MEIEFTEPQAEFVTSDARYPAFVGGLGSGKTEGGIWRTIRLKRESPDLNVAYYLPTYGLIHDIAFPRFSETFENLNIPYKLNRQHNYLEIENCGKIIFRSMDRPEKIVGYETADCVVDELDTLPTDKAQDVWGKIVARTRKKKPNGKHNTRAVVTTPEGFKFVYDKWKKSPMDGSKLIKAPTWSNPFLPDDYVDSLRESIPSNMLEAYLNGEFVNMNSASVYTEYDRATHHTRATIQPEETLHIGMDFNVGQMAAIVHVVRDNKPYAVQEHIGLLDTPAMIADLKRHYSGHQIIIYPDASGKSRKSVNASESDISLLRQAGFKVFVNNRNPSIRDRVMSMNMMFKKRHYMVNSDNCPQYVESLEKQAYNKNGDPDKQSGHDHANDAAGYFVTYRYPIKKDKAVKFKLKGI